MKKLPRITCPHCSGAGNVPVPDRIIFMLMNFRDRKDGFTAAEIHDVAIDSIGVTGWNNRLADAFRLGLLKRTKEGKAWRYRLTSSR